MEKFWNLISIQLPTKPVESIERADKIYFIVLTPKRNTIADVAIEKL